MATTQPPLVLGLEALDAGMLALVGGKAANLGELAAAGMPVPPGFCVTTHAYRRVAEGTDLTRACAALASTAPSDLAGLAGHAGRARELLRAAAVPAEVASAVSTAYAALGGGEPVPVAVRSSATAEDLPSASFAGQQETYLNVVGAETVLDAVHRCWASLWTDRAVTYRAVNGIDHASVRLAVVVQRMVDAAVAGVLFTADPVTGRRHRAVIDASPGLGEAVVSGAVNPDRFVVDTVTGEVIERRLGDKRLAVRAVPGGGTELLAQPPGQDAASLTEAQVRDLAALGERVEAHYRAPQDVEWAVDGAGRVWLTQARPITTLFPLPATAPSHGQDLRVYFCLSLAQGLHRPITPMGRSAFRVLGSSVAGVIGAPVPDPVGGPPPLTEAAGRLFLDITAAVRHPVGRELLPRVLDVMEARSAVVLRRLREDPRLAPRPGGRAAFARRLARIALEYRAPVVALEALLYPARAHRRVARLQAELTRRVDRTRGGTGHERLDAATRLLHEDVAPLIPRVAPAVAAGFAPLGLASRLLRGDARPGDLATVLRGLPHTVTTEMDLALWRLAARVRQDDAAAAVVRDGEAGDLVPRYRAGTLPAVVQAGLATFLERYGHRAVAEIDLGMPRWRDDPAHLLGVLANYLRLPPSAPDPETQFRQGAAEAEAMIATLVGRARRRSRARAAVVGFCLGRARRLAGLREMPKYLIVLALAGARAGLASVGQELAAAGRLEAADDVFFLDLREVGGALDGRDLRALVRQRRETYAEELRRRHVPRLLLSDGTEPEAVATPGADGALRGTPASAGRVSAPARVLLDPAGARLEPGEILVAPSTDPGWTPLFLTAGGLVMEMGGANSHGAVVAREYGIPAVVGVPDATSRITTGQLLDVDGAAGLVVPARPGDVAEQASSEHRTR
jgi:phosphoenolpyruvate synthase/pyruvate phosphate dikinase